MTEKNKKLMRTDYQAIFNKAYQLMDEALIAGNCGERVVIIVAAGLMSMVSDWACICYPLNMNICKQRS